MSGEADKVSTRRRALIRLGALALGAYCAPAFTTLSAAHANGSGSSGGSSGPSGSGGGSDNSGSGSSNSGSGSSNSGSGTSGSGSTAGTSASAPGQDNILLFGGTGLHIQFADGHFERVRGDQFEKSDRRGKVVERYRAKQADLVRLRKLGEALDSRQQKAIANVIEINEASGEIVIRDYRGWQETLIGSTYLLKDPNGRLVTQRPLTTRDVLRIRSMLLID